MTDPTIPIDPRDGRPVVDDWEAELAQEDARAKKAAKGFLLVLCIVGAVGGCVFGAILGADGIFSLEPGLLSAVVGGLVGAVGGAVAGALTLVATMIRSYLSA